MKIRVNVSGDKELREYLVRARSELASLSPLYRVWGITALKWIQENYRQSGAKVGGWKPLTPLTIMGRRKKSNKPLQDTGALLRSWNWKERINGVEIGTPMEIAKFHEYGTKPYEIRPRRRKWLWFGVPPSDRWTGQQAGRHMNWFMRSKAFHGRMRKWAKHGTPGVFARVVHHPGIPARRQLPTEGEIMPEIRRVSIDWIRKRLKIA